MADKSSVDRLKERLYSRTAAPDVNPQTRTPLPESAARLAQDIRVPGAESAASLPPQPPVTAPPLAAMNKKPKHSFAFYFLWGSLAFFVLAAGFAAYTFFGGGNTVSPQNIDVQIVAPSLVDSGKGATIEYIINNRNKIPLQAADLVIDYPDGTRDPNDQTQALPHDRLTIGDIPTGGQVKQTSSAVFFGAEGAQEHVTVTLEYQIAGSNAIFTKRSDVFFTIGSAPVNISINAPSEAIAGQQFGMDVTITSNSTSPIDNLALQAQYPFGFTVGDVSPQGQVGNTMWRLGTLAPGATQTVHITGTLDGADGDTRVFHFLTGSETDQTETQLATPMLSVPQTITIHKPFVTGVLSLDGQTGTSVAEPLGKQVQGSIMWQNNLQESVSNMSLTLSLQGTALDPSSVSSPTGFYDSNKGTITWTSDQNDFANVAPGASGSVSFSFKTLVPSSPMQNPRLALNLKVHATRQGGGSAPQDVTSAASATVNLASAINLSASALHFTGPARNSGPMPPVVGQPTTYAIVLALKNSSNAISGSQVTTTLPPYVAYVGSGDGNVSFDSGTRTVTWTVGDLRAGAGYSSAVEQTAFQIVLTPSVSQVGQTPALTGAIRFVGQDRFAQTQITGSQSALTTELTNDSGFSHGMGTVASQ